MTAVAQRRTPVAKSTPGRKPGVREQAAQDTRDAILKAATRIFAKHGYSGGRIDEISKAARSYDRMIYYYFGSKEALFIAVLEDMYRRFNEADKLQPDQPLESLKIITRFVWTYYQKNPEFITLLNSENLHKGKHMLKDGQARECARPAIGILDDVLKRGAADGIFRSDLQARDIYLMIAALGYFYLSNRHTLSATLGEDLLKPAAKTQWLDFMTEAVLRTVRV
jgi:AcrR family transcriptional regulator